MTSFVEFVDIKTTSALSIKQPPRSAIKALCMLSLGSFLLFSCTKDGQFGAFFVCVKVDYIDIPRDCRILFDVFTKTL